MSRKIRSKKLSGASLASNYGGWIYCDTCKQTVGYLCYATYDEVDFAFTCKCENQGSVHIQMDELPDSQASTDQLIKIKNRLCCPADESPLITIRTANLSSWHCNISCHQCLHTYAYLSDQ